MQVDLNQNRTEERKWQARFALVLALVTTVPYLMAFGFANEDWVFTGFLFGVDDGNSYIAKMLSGANGAWTFRTPYSTYPQSGLLFLFLPYLLLGKLAAPPELHTQFILLFQLFRFFGVFLIVFSAYDFIAFFEPRTVFRRVGTVLLTTGGGLGWLLVFLGQGEWLGSLPLDFYSPETFGFLAVFGLPHLAVGRALLLWAIVAYLKAISVPQPEMRAGLHVGLLLLFAGIFSPINPAIGWLLVGIHLGITAVHKRPAIWRSNLKIGLIAGLISAPIVGYSFVASLLDPFFSSWTSQNLILSPHPLHYLLAFALYVPWLFRGIKRLLSSGRQVDWLPLLWVGLLPVLAYLPFNLQRRLPEAAFAAIIVLVVKGLKDPGGEGKVSRKQVVYLLPALFSAIFLLAGSLLGASTLAEPVFRSAAEVRAFEAVGQIADPDQVVLTTKNIGNVLPAFAPVRVVIGHGPETIDFTYLENRTNEYFSGQLDRSGQTLLLEELGVDYVLGNSENTPAPPGGERVYFEDGYVIYRTR